MLTDLITIMAFQLAGEVVALISGLPLPGPLWGLLFLLGYLHVRGGPFNRHCWSASLVSTVASAIRVSLAGAVAATQPEAAGERCECSGPLPVRSARRCCSVAAGRLERDPRLALASVVHEAKRPVACNRSPARRAPGQR